MRTSNSPEKPFVNIRQTGRQRQWDAAAETYDTRWQDGEGKLYAELEAEILSNTTGANQSTRILDLCSGTGRNTLALAETGARMIGIDAASGMANIAQQKATERQFENVQFVVGNAFFLPFPDESFDAVIGTRFMYMLNPEDKTVLLSEIRRIVKPGGIVCLQFNGWLFGLKQELLKPFLKFQLPRIRHRYLWPGQAKRIFSGFNVKSVVGIKFLRLHFLSLLIGRSTALAVNKIVRFPFFRFLSSYLIVTAVKPVD